MIEYSGTYRVDELVSACRNADFTDMVFVNETRGARQINLCTFFNTVVYIHSMYSMYVCILIVLYIKLME